jgi:aspartyl-tRNA(Asn)/glutamyl-tRNA(Gln) amidotransferase subunit B
MIAPRKAAWSDRYEMVVGLEVHAQLATATKLFCRCSTDFGALPNANTCPVCLALPGVLPALNDAAVELAGRAAVALGCTIRSTSNFARKHYFYPDLPKGYQISQFDRPLAVGGCVEIGRRADGSPINIAVTRVHLEEDAGRLIHDRFAGASAVDLNRAGVPLIEIVSEPEMRGSQEADAYLRAVKQILDYAAVSDVSMERGSLRVDANVSARRLGDSALGTKVEIKNMNSFSSVARALEAEFARQCAALDAGDRVEQQTMLWDESAEVVRPARRKEGSDDYRYFPEPDLPPLIISLERIDRLKRELPELPAARRTRYRSAFPALSEYDIALLTESRATSDYFEHVARSSGDAKASANWMLREVLGALKAMDQSIDHFTVRPADLAALLCLVRDGVGSHSAAKQIFTHMVQSGDPPRQLAEREGLLRVGDDALLRQWIDEALAEHPSEAARFLGGERRLHGVIIGYVMRKSNGSADPRRVGQLLDDRVGA